jgi:hypothetical protein
LGEYNALEEIMNTPEIFARINELLEDTQYPYEITDITELEEFLNNDTNSDYEVYGDIEQLYENLMMGLDSDE